MTITVAAVAGLIVGLMLGAAFGVVPNPSNQPSAEIVGLGGADMASVQNDFSPSLRCEIKILALTPQRSYTSHAT
jgi:hypothetical protein